MALEDRQENALLLANILSKKWEDFEAEEHADYLLFPEDLIKRKKDGTFENTPIMIRVPREHEMRKARIRARGWAKKEGLEPDIDPDLFDNMDSMCVLSVAIRNNTVPYEPYEPDPERLEKVYDRVCLDALWAKLEAYRQVIDPRVANLSEEETLAIIGVIAKARNVIPLAALGGASQNSFVVTMAVRLQSLLAPKS